MLKRNIPISWIESYLPIHLKSSPESILSAVPPAMQLLFSGYNPELRLYIKLYNSRNPLDEMRLQRNVEQIKTVLRNQEV